MTADPTTSPPDYPLQIGAQLVYLMGESYMLDSDYRNQGAVTDFMMERLDMMLDAIQTIKRLRAEMEEEEATK